ncbi:MAG: Ni/Fe hydrogenase subunit alpha [Rhodospirillales bacterium 69-11]|nr:Ni/Fe hydrogenase subunit alpha [Rhodospirillales bacterium]OJW25179.1 MAG: Ni/Fe hydrogenase subunit alpha [Rhodospirillales bacterium 69-11]
MADRTPKRRTIDVDVLARVEGEGALQLVIDGDQLRRCELSIFEPPRFFEALLRGRSYLEAPDITARICGICPVAYQMSAVHAMEDALGIAIPEPIRLLRRLLYCGEWIESHGLHIYLLHAPDFLGYEGGVEMAKDHPEAVKRGLALKKAGNDIVRCIGGREIHPINVRVGGFWRTPRRAELGTLVPTLSRARDLALETVRFVGAFDFPDVTRDYEFVALGGAGEYPFNEGRVLSSRGLDIPPRDYERHFAETHVRHSNALHSHRIGAGAYLTGPLARYSLNSRLLSPLARQAAADAGIGDTCHNPFRSIVVRAVEVLYALDEALRVIDAYQEPEAPFVEAPTRSGTGYACTEAPRGMLYHRYRLAEDGTIEEAKIVPPTSQNQPSIEDDLRAFVPAWLHLPDDALRHRAEHAVRNHDPCISCATHFLRLEVQRG